MDTPDAAELPMSDRADLVTGTLFVTVALDALKALLKTDKFLFLFDHWKARFGDTVDRSTESKKAAEETYMAAAARQQHQKSKYLNAHMWMHVHVYSIRLYQTYFKYIHINIQCTRIHRRDGVSSGSPRT